jgi:hypothetical protein
MGVLGQIARMLVLGGSFALGSAQPVLASDPSPAGARPSLFLSCPLECFADYLRQELSYVDFSRDPYRAELTLVVVRQQNGGGGERFTVTLTRRTLDLQTPPAPPLSFSVPPGSPDVVTRRKLAQTILRMLQRELEGTAHEDAFELSLPARDGNALGRVDDPWDFWTITPELKAEGEGASGYYLVDGTAGLTIRRITDSTKLRLRGAYTRRLSGFLLEDGSRIHGDSQGWDARVLYAHSLGERWALGGTVTGGGSEYENLEGHVHGGALAEFNIFPYSQNASQQLRFAYQAGAWINWYLEPNEVGLLQETRPYHAISLIADVNHGWGSVQWITQLNQFLDEPSLYRVSTGAVLSLQLVEGLSISFEGEAALVRDQINQRGRPITDDELLLWTAEQPTEYAFGGALLFTYTFGSDHNTIVNPRFARVDLDEE